MNIVDVLDKNLIKIPLAGNDANTVIEEMVGLLSDALNLGKDAQDDILQAIKRREALGSTGLGKGVAVPHAKTSAVQSVKLVIGVTSHPVDFNAPDNEPVSLFFLVVAPPAALSSHVEVLASIARTCSSAVMMKHIKNAHSADAMYSLFRE
ncbi:PTS sugar transporter subunit IIA [Parasphaerochaeta coccoides]|uniref:PTS IIA-like nitrogen-regulatory protein PtsN n=1 Tax=Parasphaerochaeta coccoides (strain ATCC BAA-1237 / DSM 17374 / SPN1) TaxID=760011 RepID=F4GLK8_PARC1|nr:PTS sugar transporter subunit IIA [Parasphaerochaeta coccoides]AEC01978.1 putative PTS IIA-like nitrogen-regulatory protein PtsN [Parasphaerochaeta coccoides DSM 17374]